MQAYAGVGQDKGTPERTYKASGEGNRSGNGNEITPQLVTSERVQGEETEPCPHGALLYTRW